MKLKIPHRIRLVLTLAGVACLGLTSAKASYRVCGITLNSSDEMNVFRKALAGPGVEFEELTASADSGNPDDTSWWTTACKKTLPCDDLVISGHFAGDFFGDSHRAKLPLRTLEQSACAGDCPSVLAAPKNVFLFGCNTLADKSRDQRSNAEFRQVLLRDGFTTDAADEVIEHRYGTLGSAFRERLAFVFRNAANLFGFSSVAPLGHESAPRLAEYFQTQPHSPSAPPEMIDGPALLRSFRGTSFAVIHPNAGSIAPRDFCEITRKDLTPDEAKHAVEERLAGPNFLSDLPLMLDVFFEQHLDRRAPSDWAFPGGAIAVYQRLEGLLPSLRHSSFGVKVRALLFSIGGLPRENLRAFTLEYVNGLVTENLGLAAVSGVCALPEPARATLAAADFPVSNAFLRNPNGNAILSCLDFLRDARFYESAIRILGDHPSELLQRRILWGLQDQSDHALYSEDEKIRTDHFLTPDERAINRSVMDAYRKVPEVSSILYSFVPGNNLDPRERAFLGEILNAGPGAFTGWEYARILRVAGASGLRDELFRSIVRRYENLPRVSSAARDYFNL